MRWRILVSLVSLAVICCGVRYAVGRERLERLHSPKYLHELYQETNKEFFDGQLPDAVLEVCDLSDKQAEGTTHKYEGQKFVITLDPNWNTSEDEALDTLRHESCHVATWREEPEVHGPRFQGCMKRFEQQR